MYTYALLLYIGFGGQQIIIEMERAQSARDNYIIRVSVANSMKENDKLDKIDEGVRSVLAEIADLLVRKNREYANDDLYKNFMEAGQLMNLKIEGVIWMYVMKHIISVKNHISGEIVLPRELLCEKIKDIICYFVLMLMYVEADKNE